MASSPANGCRHEILPIQTTLTQMKKLVRIPLGAKSWRTYAIASGQPFARLLAPGSPHCCFAALTRLRLASPSLCHYCTIASRPADYQLRTSCMVTQIEVAWAQNTPKSRRIAKLAATLPGLVFRLSLLPDQGEGFPAALACQPAIRPQQIYR